VNEPRWVPESAVEEAHKVLIKQYGGSLGLRDPGGLSSSMDKAKNLFFYKGASLPELAAAYGYGLAKNHCFIDGNKRIAFAVMNIFLRMNDYELVVTEQEAITMMLGVASSAATQEELSQWIAENIQSKPFP
jgi:death on curing protein